MKVNKMSQNNLASFLSLDKCENILNKFNQENHSNLKFKSLQITAATKAKGFLGEYFHLTIQGIEHDNETELNINEGADNNAAILLRFFIKMLPQVDEQHESIMIFNKESFLYSSLLPKLQKYSFEVWCPNVYLCNKNIIILEDLENKGFYSLASQDNLSEHEMLAILNGLATMHASSLLYEFETNDNIGDTYGENLKEITVHPDIPWFTVGVKAILKVAKQHAKYQAAASQAFIVSELPLHLQKVFFMVNTSSKYRNVFCHRDTWGGNIFLNCSNLRKPAVFVDFQTCRYSPAAIDVIFTLFLNLTKQERLKKQSNYIKYYYQQLIRHVKNYIPHEPLSRIIFSEEEFLRSIEEFMLFGFVYRALAISILKVPKELVTDSYKNMERSKKLLQYMRENKEFCQLMEESIEDIIEAVAVDISLKKFN